MKIAFPFRPSFTFCVLLLTLALVAFGPTPLASSSRDNRARQSEKKALKIKYDNVPDAPYQIEDVEIDGIIADKKPSQRGRFGKYVETNHTVDRNSDWVKKLKFKYTNTSDKDIVFLNVTLLLQNPTIPDNKLGPSIFIYSAGKKDANAEIQPPIRPGQTITIQMKEALYRLFKKMCDDNGLIDLDTIDEAEIDISETYFADGSVWTLGAYFDPNPSNPLQKIRRPKRISLKTTEGRNQNAEGSDRRRVSELAGRRTAEKPGDEPGFFSLCAVLLPHQPRAKSNVSFRQQRQFDTLKNCQVGVPKGHAQDARPSAPTAGHAALCQGSSGRDARDFERGADAR